MEGTLPQTDLGVQGQSQGQPQGSPQVTPPVAQEAPDLTQLEGYMKHLKEQESKALEKPEEKQPLPRVEVDESYSPEVQTTLKTLNFMMPDVDMQVAFGKALEEGNSDLIDVRELRRVYGDTPEVEYVVQTLSSIVDAVGSTSQATYTEVFESVGGQEAWQGIASFFNANATPTEIAIAEKLTKSRNPDEIKQGAEYVIAFAQRSGAVPKTPQGLQTGTSGASGMGLSQEAFLEEYAKLKDSPQWNRDPIYVDQAVAELDRLRALGIRNGL